jgi:hypothetical protein
MATYTSELTDAGLGPEFSIRKGDSFSYATSGTFELLWTLQASTGGGWVNVASGDGEVSATVKAETDARYRFVVHTPGETPGTLTITVTELVPADRVLLITNAAGQAKAGAEAGWVVAAGALAGVSAVMGQLSGIA